MGFAKSVTMAFGRTTILLIAGSVLAVTIAATALVTRAAWTQDRLASDQSRHFVEVLIRNRVAWLDKMLIDYSDWGNAYTNLHLKLDVDWAYTQNNIGHTLVDDLGIDYGAVFDGQDDEVYAVVDGQLQTTPGLAFPSSAILDLVNRARSEGPDGHFTVNGIFAWDGEPVLVSAAVLAPGDDATVQKDDKIQSVLVFGDRLTWSEVAAMRTDLGVATLEFQPVAATLGKSKAVILSTTDGRTDFELGLAAPRPGTEMLKALLPWFSSLVLALTGLMVLFARHGFQVAGTARMVSAELAEAHRLANHQARHDPLTGLWNRTSFAETLKAGLAETPVRMSLLYLDLDRFKPLNDTFGHEAGDHALIEISRRLTAALEPGECCARIGGDEFVILSRRSGDGPLRSLCLKLIRDLSAQIIYRDSRLAVGVSIGVATALEGERSEEIMRRADKALYHAKSGGRGRICVSAPQAEPSSPRQARSA